jgi:hypothetical protein
MWSWSCRRNRSLPDGIATVILAQEVLEHVPAPAATLADLVRIGRAGARYLIDATPQGRAAIQALDEVLPKSQVVLARKAA